MGRRHLADAIKTAKGLQTGDDSEGGDPGISIPIGGTTTSKIYLDGSRTLADIDASLSDAGGLCGAIPAGSVVRDPALSKGTSGVTYSLTLAPLVRISLLT